MKVDRAAFSLRLMRLLKLRGLSITGLARQLGMNRGQFYRWLNGAQLPAIDVAARVADELGCTPGFLLFGDAPAGAISSEQMLSDRLLVARIPAPRGPGRPISWQGLHP